MMIKKILALLLVLSLALTAVACSSPAPEEQSTANETSGATQEQDTELEEVELRVAWFGNESRHELLNAICDGFEALNPHVSITREFATTSDYWQKVTTQMAGKNAPDVFVCQYDRFENFIDKGQLLQLDDLVASGDLDVSNFQQAHIDNGTVDGDFYGVSLGGSIRLLIYNETMMAEAGVEVPNDLEWTWDDFEQICADLKAYYTDPGVYVIEDFTGSTDALQAYVRSRGYDYFVDGEIGFPEEVLSDFMEMGQRLRDIGAIPSPEINAELGGKSQAESMLAAKQVIFQIKPSNQLPLYQVHMEDALDVLLLPGYEGIDMGDYTGSGSFIGSTNWVVPAYTEVPEVAAQFISYFSNNEEAVDIWKIELGPLPSNEMAAYINPQLSESDQRVVEFCTDMIPLLKPIAGLPENGSEALSSVTSYIEQARYGQMTIEEAVAEYYANAEQILQQ